MTPQIKKRVDDHHGPALITTRDGSIQYTNAHLKELFQERNAASLPAVLFELGSVDVAKTSSELESFFKTHGKSLNVTLTDLNTAPAMKLQFTVDAFTANEDGYAVLLSSPPSGQKDLTSLESRVLKQTAKLAAQSEKRAKAEELAKLEAERKVSLIGNTVHHLNNPLNQIQGAFELVHREIVTLRQTVNELLQTEEPDPQADALREELDSQFGLAVDNINAIENASDRIADTIDILRLVSGIDGWSFKPTTIKDIALAAMRRLGSNLEPKLNALIQMFGETQVMGHPVIYAQAIEEIERSIDQLRLESKQFSVEIIEDTCLLIWDNVEPYSLEITTQSLNPPQVQLTDMKILHRLQQEIEHLLQAYHVKLELAEARLTLRLPARGSFKDPEHQTKR